MWWRKLSLYKAVSFLIIIGVTVGPVLVDTGASFLLLLPLVLTGGAVAVDLLLIFLLGSVLFSSTLGVVTTWSVPVTTGVSSLFTADARVS